MASVTERLKEAVRLHQAGQLAAAEPMYRQILAEQPQHVDAWQLLGLIAHQCGKHEVAIEYIRRAIDLGGKRAEVYCNLGAAYQALGRGDDAEASFREAIRLRPDFALGHLNLAESLRKRGQPAPALESYREALRLQPDWALAHFGLGQSLDALKQPADAAESFRAAIRCKPDYHDACNNLGNALGKLGRMSEAAQAYEQAIQIKPNFAEAHNNLGTVRQHEGRHDDAIACYRKALELNPQFADPYCNLGAALQNQGRYEEALANLQQAVRLRADLAEAHANVSAVLQRLGRPAEAATSAERAVELQPDMPAGHINLGGSLEALGRLSDAEKCFRKAIQCDPAAAAAHSALGTVLKNQGRLAEAEASSREAIRLQPHSSDHYNNLGNVLQEQARTDEARAAFGEALRLRPHDGLRMKAALLVPVISTSTEEIERRRARIREDLRQFLAEGLSIGDPTTEVGLTAFHLAYHGRANRDIHADVAKVYLHAAPALTFVAPHCLAPRAAHGDRPLRVGFLSKFFSNHPITKHYSGVLRNLSRERFHVTLLRTAAPEDAHTRSAFEGADRVVTLGRHLTAAQRAVADEQLDALVYTDIGMDPFTYFLAFSRLAPVQCVLPGHPDTTGVPTIDYFLSAADMEPPNAQEHYTERLVQLENLPTYYDVPRLTTPPLARADFQLPAEGRLYLCGQTLFKLHPDFDAYLAGILQADPEGFIVLLGDKQRHWTRPLAERLRAALGDNFARVHFIPRQTLERFRHLLTLADAVLDTIYFNGGTTTLDALGVGAPVVTQPGEFMRGRTTLACYRKMDLYDCVAQDREEYIRIATRMATDRDWREHLRREIVARRDVLFGNLGSVRELEQFLLRALAAE